MHGRLFPAWGSHNKKKHSEGKNCQDNLQQKSYLGGQTNNMTGNIGEDWKEIGNNGKENKQENKEPWKQ